MAACVCMRVHHLLLPQSNSGEVTLPMECAEDYNLIEPSLKGCFLPTLMTVCCCWGCNTSPT